MVKRFTKSSVSVEEIQALLLANLMKTWERSKILQAHIRQELREEERLDEDAKASELITRSAPQLCAVVASRLKRNTKNIELLTKQDLKKLLIPEMFSALPVAMGGRDAEFQKQVEGILEEVFQQIKNAFLGLSLPRKSPYDDYWRWIQVVYTIAEEHDISPTEIVTRQEWVDEVTRRFNTREEYVAMMEYVLQREGDTKAFTQGLLDRILNLALLECEDEEEAAELRRRFQTEVLPDVLANFERKKSIVQKWMNEEADRIYGPGQSSSA